MAIIRSTRVQKLTSWACFDQNNPKPIVLKQRHVNDLVHGVFHVLVLVSMSVLEVRETIVLIQNMLFKSEIKTIRDGSNMRVGCYVSDMPG